VGLPLVGTSRVGEVSCHANAGVYAVSTYEQNGGMSVAAGVTWIFGGLREGL
jgi:hypothetical protein